MPDIDDLIRAATTEAQAGPAVRSLIAAGPAALRRVVEVSNEQSRLHLPALYEVIRASSYAEAVPILLASARGGSYGTLRSSLQALAASGDQSARELLITLLTDRTELTTRRAAAAEALYGSPDPEAATALRSVVAEQEQELDNPEWPQLLVQAVTALATLNDHGAAPALYRILDIEYDTGRALAVKAFRIVTDSQSLRQLERVTGDPSAEVRRAAIDPLFLIGSPACAAILLRLAEEDQDDEVRYNSMIRFGDIMGLALAHPEDLPFAREEWRAAREHLQADRCYRMGEPIALGNLLEQFRNEETLREDLAEEMHIITGVDVPSTFAGQGHAAALRSVADVSLTPGRLYKWGHPRPVPEQ